MTARGGAKPGPLPHWAGRTVTQHPAAAAVLVAPLSGISAIAIWLAGLCAAHAGLWARQTRASTSPPGVICGCWAARFVLRCLCCHAVKPPRHVIASRLQARLGVYRATPVRLLATHYNATPRGAYRAMPSLQSPATTCCIPPYLFACAWRLLGIGGASRHLLLAAANDMPDIAYRRVCL